MRITGIVFIILGTLALLHLIITLLLPDGRDLPFVGGTWSPIVASFLLGGGAALLVASRTRKRPR